MLNSDDHGDNVSFVGHHLVPGTDTGIPADVLAAFRQKANPRMVGAYAYVNYAGYVSLRLPAASADGSKFAHARNVKASNPYVVRISLTTGASVDEANRLAGEAYGQAQG